MTEQDIDLLPVGPDLDAQIARLLGDDIGDVPEHRWGEDYYSGSGEYRFKKCARCGLKVNVHGDPDNFSGPCWLKTRHYSTNIKVALPLLETIQASDGGRRRAYLTLNVNEPPELRWQAGPINTGDYGEDEPDRYGFSSGQAETAALAICRALLKCAQRDTERYGRRIGQ